MPRRLNPTLPFKALLLGGIVSALAAMMWQRWLMLDAEQDIAAGSAELEARIAARIQAYLALLRGTTGLFAVNRNVGREEFQRYVSAVGLDQSYPGVQGIGFSLRVAAGEVEK